MANRWLEQVPNDHVLEVGAVTPYYWPRRVSIVLDPTDGHPLVTRRRSLFDERFHDRAVLSISTLEHVGMGHYGLAADPPQSRRALQKLFEESPRFLVTVPIGFNPLLDDFLFASDARPRDVSIAYLVRIDEFRWREERDPSRARVSYGELWANSIAVIERGGIVLPGAYGNDPKRIS